MMKRMLAALVCLTMVLALLPATALADDVGIPATGLDLTSSPTTLTTYTAGTGTVTWNPTMGRDPADVIGGTLTLNSAQIELVSGAASFFTLPAVPVKIELNGESTFSTTEESGSGTVSNSANFFVSQFNSVELTGSGFINSTTGGYIVDAPNGSVTLTGGTHTGKIKAENVALNNITIPEDLAVYLEGVTGTVTISNVVNNGTLNLEDVTGTVTTLNMKNNGTLVLKRKTDTGADIAAIKALELTGSGYVQAKYGTSNYYTNDGTVIPGIGGSMNFSTSTTLGNWSAGATVEENGYRFTGNSTSGYTLELGNLVIENGDPAPCITLPGDGPVKVILTKGTTARIISNGGYPAIQFKKSQEYPCTITGSGRLVLDAAAPNCLLSQQPLTIAGGDITIINRFNLHTAYGINTDAMPLTLSGGKLSIRTKSAAIKADQFTLGSGMQITSPAGACFTDGFLGTMVDDDFVVAKNVIIQPAPSSGGDYMPSPVTVYNDPSVPNATVWLSGRGLDNSDLLITERDPQGSAYKALLKLADSDDVFGTYNIYLRSGKRAQATPCS